MIKLPSLTRLPSHRSFEFKPRFYDEQKEHQQELKKRIELKKLGFESRSNIKGSFSKNRVDIRRKSSTISLAIRWIIILLFVGLLIYLFQAFEQLNKFFQ